MSLINEALKKARLEAARQDAARRGIPYPARLAEPRRPGAAARGAVALTIAAGAVAIGLWLAGRDSATDGAAVATRPAPLPAVEPAAQAPAAPRRPEPVATPPAAPRAPAAVVDRGAETAAQVPPPAAASPPAPAPALPRPAPVDPARTEPPAAAEPALAEPQTISQPAPAPALETEAAVAAATTAGAVGAGRAPAAGGHTAGLGTFVGAATIPGAGSFELRGIAWSSERPSALINGRVLGPGDRVGGATVLAIDPGSVRLGSSQGEFVLRLR